MKGLDLNVLLQGVGKRDYWLGGAALFPFGAAGATEFSGRCTTTRQTIGQRSATTLRARTTCSEES